MAVRRSATARRVAAWRKALPPGTCRRCTRLALRGLSSCARCLAYALEAKPWLEGMRHETDAHALMLALARLDDSRCAVAGLTRAELREAGYDLQVDRIDSGQGYTAGNMQLLASRLNRLKSGTEWMEPRDFPARIVEDFVATVRHGGSGW